MIKTPHGKAMRLASSTALAAALLLSACGGGAATDGGASTASGALERAQAVTTSAPVAATDLKVLSLAKVSETRVSRTVYDYVFKVTVRNSGGTAFNNIVLSVQRVGAGSSVVDGRVALSSLAAGSEVQTTDTITLRHDRSKAFDPTAINWTIEGTPAVLTPKEQIAALEASGALPKLDRSASLLGPLAASGVREDVEAHIVKNYATPEQQNAARQTAVAFQNTLVVDLSDQNAVLEANRKESYALHCTYSKFDRNGASKHPAQVIMELRSMITNTKPRLLAYLAFNKALDGQTWSLPEGDTCE